MLHGNAHEQALNLPSEVLERAWPCAQWEGIKGKWERIKGKRSHGENVSCSGRSGDSLRRKQVRL